MSRRVARARDSIHKTQSIQRHTDMSQKLGQKQRLRKRRQNIGGIAIGGVSVLGIIILLMGCRIWDCPTPVSSDNCPENQNYTEQIAILVDPSDSLTEIQKKSGVNYLMNLVQNAPEMTEIQVYTAGRAGRGNNTNSEYRICKPKHPADVSPVTGNQRLATKQYEDNFRAPLEKKLITLLDQKNDTISPIIEGIQVAKIDAFQPISADIPRQLFVMSDMMQNSMNLSFYRDPVDFGMVSRNEAYGKLRVNLKNVKVSVFLLARRGEVGRLQVAGGSLRRFWEDYFMDQEASSNARLNWIMVEG